MFDSYHGLDCTSCFLMLSAHTGYDKLAGGLDDFPKGVASAVSVYVLFATNGDVRLVLIVCPLVDSGHARDVRLHRHWILSLHACVCPCVHMARQSSWSSLWLAL